MITNRIVIIVAAAGVIAAASAHWRDFALSGTVREEQCRSRIESCSQSCDINHRQDSGEIVLERRGEDLRHRSESITCNLEYLGDPAAKQGCLATEDRRHEAAVRRLDARQQHADATLTACRQGCCDAAAGRGCPACGSDRTNEVTPDTSFVIECIEGPGTPCFHEVPDICQRLTGVCQGCELTLCADQGWTLQAELLVDATLMAGTGPGAGRPLASATARDGRATLAVPRDIKLQSGEKLQLQFRFSGPPAMARKVTLHRERSAPR